MCKATNCAPPAIAFEIVKTFVTIPEPRHPAAACRSASAPPTARFTPTQLAATPQHQATKTKHPATTVMVRNLPNRTKLDRMQTYLTQLGCDQYDSVYMPIDSRTGMNKGYAFVHFSDAKHANFFREKVEGTQLPNSQSSKRLTASLAVYQGAAVKPKKVSQEPQTPGAGSFASLLWTK